MNLYDAHKTDPGDFPDEPLTDAELASLLSSLPPDGDSHDYLPEPADGGYCWRCEGAGRRGAWIATVNGGRMWGEILCRDCGGTGAERRAA